MPQRRIQLGGLVAALAVTAGLGTCSAAQALHVRDAVGLSLASLGLETSLGLLAWSGALLSTQRVGERLGLGPGRIGPRWLLLLVIGTLGVSQGLDGLLELSGLRSRSALSDLDMQLAGIRDGELGLALLAIGLVPGIAEEIFCRGLVQRGLERSLGPGVAIAAAALVAPCTWSPSTAHSPPCWGSTSASSPGWPGAFAPRSCATQPTTRRR
jgi:membrane protease YdiL (CAAX protease family)